MTLRDRYLERIVGTFLAASGMAFVLMVAFSLFGRGWFTDTHTYTLTLDNATGITPGVEVTLAGLRVGSVQAIQLTPERRVRLDLRIDAQYAPYIRTDSVARATMTLSGKVVIIDGGSADAPELGDGGALVSGGNFDALLALEKMDLVGNLERMQRILEDLNTLASQLRLGDGRLPEAVDGLVSLIGKLQRGEGSLGRLLQEDAPLDDVTGAVRELSAMSGAVSEAADALRATAGALDRASGAVVETAPPVASASAAVGTGADAVAGASARIGGAVDQLAASLAELERTLRAIQGMPIVRGQVRKADEAGAPE